MWTNKEIKTALISGGTSGIGLAIVKKFLQNNITVSTFSNSKTEIKKTKNELKDYIKNKKLFIYQADITKKQNIKRVVDQSIKNLKHINVLVNNAGIAYFTKIDNLDIEKFEKMVYVNITGLVYLTSLVVPYKKKKKGTEIVLNISSIAGKRGTSMSECYAATKFAVQGFSQGLRREIVPEHIKIVTVCPGIVNTKIGKIRLKSKHQNKKTLLNPEDIAEIVYFIISEPIHVDIQDITVVPFEGI